MAFKINVIKWLLWIVETMYKVECIIPFPNLGDVRNTMLAHRLRRWPSIKPALVQRLVFAGLRVWQCCWRQVQANTAPMSVKCWASVACTGQHPSSTSQYFMLAGLRAHSMHLSNVVWPGNGLMHATQTHCRLYGLYQHDAMNQSWVNWAAVCEAGPHSVWRQTRHSNQILG